MSREIKLEKQQKQKSSYVLPQLADKTGRWKRQKRPL